VERLTGCRGSTHSPHGPGLVLARMLLPSTSQAAAKWSTTPALLPRAQNGTKPAPHQAELL